MRKLLMVAGVGLAWLALVVLPPIAPVYAQDTTTLLANFLNALRSGTPTVPVGGSLTTAGVSASLTTNTTSASNVSTSETDLMTYSLPANTLSSNGQKVRITAWGTFAANANNKTVKLYFGSTVLVTTGAAGFNNQSWEAVGVATRTGAATQVGLGKFFANNGATATNFITTTSPTETLSGAITIKVTGTSGTASSDVTALGMFVEWVP